MLGLLQRKDPGNEVGIISTQIVFLVRMSAEYLNSVTFGLANRFVGFTRLKSVLLFQIKNTISKNHRGTLEVIVKIN